MGRVYLIPINELSGKTPILSQLRKYQKRSVVNGRTARLGLVPDEAPDTPKIPDPSQVKGPEFDQDITPLNNHVKDDPELVQLNVDP